MPIARIYGDQGILPGLAVDAVDLATGAGLTAFYGYDYKFGSTTSYALTTQIPYSEEGVTQTTSEQTKIADFDIKFKRPVQIEGAALVSVPMRIQTTGSVDVSCAVTLKLISGTTVTDIASGNAVKGKNWGANELHIWNINLDMGKKKIKTNDTMRLSVRYVSPTTKTIDWFHDPKNRATINTNSYSTESSQLVCYLPVVIKP